MCRAWIRGQAIERARVDHCSSFVIRVGCLPATLTRVDGVEEALACLPALFPGSLAVTEGHEGDMVGLAIPAIAVGLGGLGEGR